MTMTMYTPPTTLADSPYTQFALKKQSAPLPDAVPATADDDDIKFFVVSWVPTFSAGAVDSTSIASDHTHQSAGRKTLGGVLTLYAGSPVIPVAGEYYILDYAGPVHTVQGYALVTEVTEPAPDADGRVTFDVTLTNAHPDGWSGA